jgi:hypothetical protein
VVWTYVVTNIGDMLLSDVTVIDDNGTPGDVTDDVVIALGISMAPGTSDSFDALGVATEGLYRNVATVTTDQGVSDNDASHYVGILEEAILPIADLVFAVDIELATDGEDADLPEAAVAVGVGNELVWSYVVTNTSDNPLTNLIVIDDAGTPQNHSDDIIVASGFDLAGGESIQFTRNGIGHVGLFGTVAVVDSAEGATDIDPTHYQGSPIVLPNTGTGGLLSPVLPAFIVQPLDDEAAAPADPHAIVDGSPTSTSTQPDSLGVAGGGPGAWIWLLALLAVAGTLATTAGVKQRRR